MRVRKFSVVLVVLASASGLQSAPAADVKALAASVDGHYNHLRTLQADFTEFYRGSGIERTESGTLLLKKSGKMRWEYRSPREKVFVSDGNEAWFYVPADRQARKVPVRQLDDLRSPLAFLLGKTKLEKELHGLSKAVDIPPLAPEDTVLRGIPVGMEDRVSEIVLEITPGYQLARIVINEVDGSATEYRFTRQQEGVAISDSQFHFHAPAGTETVDSELGQ